MESGYTRRPGMLRLLAVCALLFGLFAMHGLPASAADGCHTETSAAAAMPAMGGGMAVPAADTAAVHSGTVSAGAQLHAGSQATTGSLCVTALGRDRIALPVLALLAVAALWTTAGPVLRGSVAAFLARRRRGPPIAGRSLLNRVCVSRT